MKGIGIFDMIVFVCMLFDFFFIPDKTKYKERQREENKKTKQNMKKETEKKKFKNYMRYENKQNRVYLFDVAK